MCAVEFVCHFQWCFLTSHSCTCRFRCQCHASSGGDTCKSSYSSSRSASLHYDNLRFQCDRDTNGEPQVCGAFTYINRPFAGLTFKHLVDPLANLVPPNGRTNDSTSHSKSFGNFVSQTCL